MYLTHCSCGSNKVLGRLGPICVTNLIPAMMIVVDMFNVFICLV